MTAKEIAALFEDLELRLVASLKRNMLRHRKMERDEGGKNGVPENWEAWQSAKLRDIRRFRRENQDILGKYAPTIDAETEAMLREQYAEGSADGFFHTSDDKLRTLLEEMRSNEGRVEKAALRYMDDVYRKTVLRSAVALNAGGATLQQAVDGATQDFLAQGINCMEYANGRCVNISSYAEMALRTCATRAMLMGEARQRARMGVNTVLVSQYGLCSDTCLPWQGKVYIDDVFQEYTGPRGGSFGVALDGHQYLFLSVAMQAGLFHPNCRHTVSTWIRGVSRMPKPMDAAQIEKNNKLEARQRTLERRVRQAKRQAAGLTDPKAQKDAREKVKTAQAELREFVREHGDVLRRDPWRERDDLTRENRRPEGSSYAANKDTLEIFAQNRAYRDAGGFFDIGAAKDSYGSFLTSVPEKNRIYLQQAFETVGYAPSKTSRAPFGYSEVDDTIYYDPEKPDFWRMDFTSVNTHELAHRIDRLFVGAEKNDGFCSAIRSAYEVINAQPEKFMEFCKHSDRQGFLSDICSAISENAYDFPAGHSTEYWQIPGKKEKEIFANLFSLETFSDKDCLRFIQENFPDVFQAYQNMEYEVS